MNCTIVSAYYPVKSKAIKDTYLEWGKLFMKLEAPIVFFTEEHLIEELQILRENRPITFIPIPLEKLDTWILYSDKWIQHHFMDPEKQIHSPELYAVWAQKAFFLENVTKMNPYNTEYFVWCDFGFFRDPSIPPSIFKTFPQTKHLSEDKIIILAINDMKDYDKTMNSDGIYGEPITVDNWREVRLGAGVFGGGITACKKWKIAYQTMLEKYFLVNRFAGKEQVVMFSTYVYNPTLANIVTHTKYDIDVWFFFQYLLSDQEVEYRLNQSYKM
jgi:hypothetical protein